MNAEHSRWRALYDIRVNLISCISYNIVKCNRLHYKFAAERFHKNKLCSEVKFNSQKQQFRFFELYPSWDVGVMYALHLEFVG